MSNMISAERESLITASGACVDMRIFLILFQYMRLINYFHTNPLLSHPLIDDRDKSVIFIQIHCFLLLVGVHSMHYRVYFQVY